jgi:hypothetical protein
MTRRQSLRPGWAATGLGMAALWALSLSTCDATIAVDSHRYACAVDRECGRGFACLNGVCEALEHVGDDAGAPRDGGGDAGEHSDAGGDGGPACSPNVSCLSANGCWQGLTNCSTGASQCQLAQAVAHGTQCGSTSVCDGDGGCRPCQAGTTCAGDPCAGGCDALASCSLSLGCQCPRGYVGNGRECVDVDECLLDAGGCGLNAVCANTAGSRTCACAAGFSGDGGLCEADAVTIELTTSTSRFDVAAALGPRTFPVRVTVNIAAGAVVSGTALMDPALTTGAVPAGSSVTIKNAGSIIGAGGAGGSGGNGNRGSSRCCGRDGLPGGTAIELTVPATLQNTGFVFGGGGGGAGYSGCGRAAGGGGGAGSPGGPGGPGASALSLSGELAFCGEDDGVRTGIPGADGGVTPGIGVALSCGSTGSGGGYGLPGESGTGCTAQRGGGAGYAIKRNGNPLTNVPDGPYDGGSGRLRGRVGD